VAAFVCDFPNIMMMHYVYLCIQDMYRGKCGCRVAI